MDSFPMAAVLVRWSMDEARSALPDAPVVPDRSSTTRLALWARPVRTAVAAGLERAARFVEPAPTLGPRVPCP